MKSKYYAPDGRPIGCHHCGCRILKEEIMQIDQNTVSEFKVTCEKCKETVGYWAYGSYDPKYTNEPS